MFLSTTCSDLGLKPTTRSQCNDSYCRVLCMGRACAKKITSQVMPTSSIQLWAEKPCQPTSSRRPSPARATKHKWMETQSSVRAASYFAYGRCIVGSLGSPLDTDRHGAPRFQPACGLVSFAFRQAKRCRQHSAADSTSRSRSRSTYEIAPGNAAIHATAADDGLGGQIIIGVYYSRFMSMSCIED
jgi:hypothetical protein